MKKLILIASLIAAGAASAETIATSPNDGGGKLILTDIVGTCINGYKTIHAYNTKGSTMQGCWKIVSQPFDSVRVVWTHYNGNVTNVEVRNYELENWDVTAAGVAQGYSASENRKKAAANAQSI